MAVLSRISVLSEVSDGLGDSRVDGQPNLRLAAHVSQT